MKKKDIILEDYFFGVQGNWIYKYNDDNSVLKNNHDFSVDEISSFYKTYYTHKKRSDEANRPNSFKKKIVDFFFEKTKFETMLLDSNKTKNLSIGDFGSGNGALLSHFSQKNVVMGYEMDDNAIKAAQESYGIPSKKINFTTEHINASHDVIFCNHVIEHIYDGKDLIYNVVTSLSDNGVAIISTPNLDSFTHKIFGKFWRGLEAPRHLRIYSSKYFIKILESIRENGDISGHKIIVTNRMSRHLFKSSYHARSGQRIEQTFRYGKPLRLISAFYQILLNAITKIYPDAGEEIIVIIFKGNKSKELFESCRKN